MAHFLPTWRRLAALLPFLAGATAASAQISLTATPYQQDFNTLPTTGATNAKSTLPMGWDFVEAGTSGNDTYGTSNGSSNSGNTYSFGATNSTERAFGTLRSGSTIPTIGASFVNNTGAAITSLVVNYVGETWRIGTVNRTDQLTFQYSTDATSLSTGTWTTVSALNYLNAGGSPVTPSAGNTAPVHTAVLSSTLSSLNVAPGATIWIRWNDEDASGADDGMGVDEFAIGLPGALTPAPVLTVTPATLNLGNQNINTTSPTQSYSLAVTNPSADVTVTAPTPFVISKSATDGFGTTLTFTPAELATAQTVYVRFTPTVAGRASGTITHTSTGATAKDVTVNGYGIDPSVVMTTFNFDDCLSAYPVSQGWSEYSVQGEQTWACTEFGHDAADATGKASAPNGVQINGYAGGTNVANEDWFISPAFNTSSFTYPLFSFWSRVAFNGAPLQLKVSTNYSGTGSPAATGVTWTDLDVAFPAIGSDAWTKTSNVDLSAYKAEKMYVAFVYYSTSEEGARWTLDDISLVNSATAPAPAITTATKGLDFGYQAVNTSATQTFNVTLRNLTAAATVTATGTGFQLSKDGTTFSNALTYTAEEANNQTKTVTVRFSPTTAAQNYTGTLTVATTDATSVTVALSGNTYNTANTLEVVNWNLEWFGSTANGPADDDQQQANVRTILNSIKADIYGLVEVVDTARLGTIVRQLPGGGYTYRVSDFGSYADNLQDPDYAGAQKLAFVYNTNIFSKVTISDLFRCTQAQNCAGYNPWSSGRFPYVLDADVTLNGTTQHFTFILIHAKANTSPTATSYDRRKAAAEQLKAELDANYQGKNVVILGDFNDDLDQTITTGLSTTASSYSAFTSDAANYTALTLPLSLAGQRSTVSYNDIIDHVVVTKATEAYYVPTSAAILTGVANLVTNYGNTTTDHYPVQTRYAFGVATPTKNAAASRALDLYPNPVANSLKLTLPQAGKSLHLVVHAVDGRTVVEASGSLEQVNQQLNQRLGRMASGMYILQVVSNQQTYTTRFIKQ